MADVFADRPEMTIGQILLPGAFNSTSYACDVEHGISPDSPELVYGLWGENDAVANDEMRDRIVGWSRHQGRSVGQQLEDGIRFVEMNVTMKEGVVTTWHSVYGVPLGDVLDELVAFAVAWPDEVVVVTFGLSIDSADWPALTELLVESRAHGVSFCDLVYDGTEDAAQATLADVGDANRNLIWSPSGDLRLFLEESGDCPLSQGGTDRSWSVTATTSGTEDALSASVDSRDPSHLLINDFAFSLDGAEGVAGQAEFLLNYEGVQETSLVLGFAGDFPERMISAFDGNGNMNIFAGAYYEDTTLVEAAIARNRARLTP